MQSQNDRAQILAGLASVDAVTIFDEDTPFELIETIRPDVLTKGGDYQSKENVIGWKQVESWNGEVVLIDLIEGRSTSTIIKRAA